MNESTIRKNYMPKMYVDVVKQIQSKINKNYIWISANETSDLKGRCVLNVIVRIFNYQQPGEQFLISTTFSSSLNAEQICEIVKTAISKYISDNSKSLLFVSDAASVMLKTGRLLKNYFPNMLHLTCFAHALHRVCKFIRDNFPKISQLISLFKKILLKAPSRIALYKEICPNIPLPPQPIITRWSTWLKTACFFFNSFP